MFYIHRCGTAGLNVWHIMTAYCSPSLSALFNQLSNYMKHKTMFEITQKTPACFTYKLKYLSADRNSQ